MASTDPPQSSSILEQWRWLLVLVVGVLVVARLAWLVGERESASNSAVSPRPRIASDAGICRAAIATLYGHSIEIVSAAESPGDHFQVWFRRPSDDSLWSTKCQIDGHRVRWGSLDGRWRDDEIDEKVLFRETGEALVIEVLYPDGSSTTERYQQRQLDSPPTPSSVPPDEQADRAQADVGLAAFVVCRQFVEEQLKAPSTAEFAPMHARGVEVLSLGSGEYEVLAHVDSQNSFGAMLRDSYLCVVRHLGEDRFQLLRLDFNSTEREGQRRQAEKARRIERKSEREREQAEAEVRLQREAIARAETERKREENRLAEIERRRRQDSLQRQRSAQMPGWHAAYLRELAPVRSALGAVTEAWNEGHRGTGECTHFQATLDRVRRDELTATPDPAIGRHLERMLEAFERGARLCAAGQRFGAEEQFKAAAREWSAVAELFERYGLQP